MTQASAARQRARRARLATLALALIAVAGCRPTPDTAAPAVRAHPVVLIGIDGLEWGTILRMVTNDRLPALASLMRNGTFGALDLLKKSLEVNPRLVEARVALAEMQLAFEDYATAAREAGPSWHACGPPPSRP